MQRKKETAKFLYFKILKISVCSITSCLLNEKKTVPSTGAAILSMVFPSRGWTISQSKSPSLTSSPIEAYFFSMPARRALMRKMASSFNTRVCEPGCRFHLRSPFAMRKRRAAFTAVCVDCPPMWSV